jgi:hypothetical protein
MVGTTIFHGWFSVIATRERKKGKKAQDILGIEPATRAPFVSSTDIRRRDNKKYSKRIFFTVMNMRTKSEIANKNSIEPKLLFVARLNKV